jgi:hypothetical protein
VAKYQRGIISKSEAPCGHLLYIKDTTLVDIALAFNLVYALATYSSSTCINYLAMTQWQLERVENDKTYHFEMRSNLHV